MSWQEHGRIRVHKIGWDPRPWWRRAIEKPLRMIGFVSYDPVIQIPEDEFVWDKPGWNDIHKSGRVALLVLFGYFAAVVLFLEIMSLFFR